MKRIIPCLLVAAILLVMIDYIGIRPAHASEDCIYVDDEETASGIDQEALYQEIFAPDSVIDIAVDISKEQLANMQADLEYFRQKHSRSSVYRICDNVTITVNGRKYVINDVGIRLKGTSSRCNFFNDILGIYNLVNFRISFSCTFEDIGDYGLETRTWNDKAEKKKRQNRTFATMESLELKWNITADNTYVRNKYVQDVFKDYGVPAQNCSLCSLSLGGCRLGVYRLFEPVDESFIRRYFPQEDWGGDLYKARCTSKSPVTYSLGNTYGIGNKKKAEAYNFDLKTNIDESHHEAMEHFLRVVNQPDATKQDFESVMDMDELARVQAVNFAMGNQDDMRNNYNNHYIYFRKSDGKAVIIPYDNEIVMGDTFVWGPSESALTGESPYLEYNYRFDSMLEVPMLRQTVLRGGYFTDLYTGYLRQIAESKWMTEAHFQKYFDTAKMNYSDKLVSKYSYFSTMRMNIDFSMEGGEACNGNMSVDEFMTRMKENILRNAA
ncbi:MAG: CotH kinase family protein [Clostridia bacterium]|nr:CotH kinase family protein [Clostridia bacterium]